jgi:hypothetical protein
MINNVIQDNPKKYFDCEKSCYEDYRTLSFKIKNDTMTDLATNDTFFTEICYCDLKNCYLKNLFG